MRSMKIFALCSLTGSLFLSQIALAESRAGDTQINRQVLSAKGTDNNEEIIVLKKQMEMLSQKVIALEADLKLEKEERAKLAPLSIDVQSLKSADREIARKVDRIDEVMEKEKVAKAKDSGPRVDTDKATSKVKVLGRMTLGFQKSESAGANPRGSFNIPDNKLQFNLMPNDTNTVVSRFGLNNAAFNSVEYMYLETNWQKFSKLRHPFMTRLGKLKLDFGEEGSNNNPTEGALPTTSAGNVFVVDEGLSLWGKCGNKNQFGWVFATGNANAGVVTDNSVAKSFQGKLSYNCADPISGSISFYNSGSANNGTLDMTFAGLATDMATGPKVTNWNRSILEMDLRYDWKKGKNAIPAFTDSKAYLRAALGTVTDSPDGVGVVDGHARYHFIEGLYNFSDRLYSVARYSLVRLEDDLLATLNGVKANEYRRTSMGFGWRWSKNLIMKLAYDWNRESGIKITDSPNNQTSFVISTIY